MLGAPCHYKPSLNLGSNGQHRCEPSSRLQTRLVARLGHMGSPQLEALDRVVVSGQVLPYPCNGDKDKLMLNAKFLQTHA